MTLTTDHLVLLPAVDVAGGQAVRLVQGAAGSETAYGEPLAAALAWQEAGADWIVPGSLMFDGDPAATRAWLDGLRANGE